jgi:hypothetical protein
MFSPSALPDAAGFAATLNKYLQLHDTPPSTDDDTTTKAEATTALSAAFSEVIHYSISNQGKGVVLRMLDGGVKGRWWRLVKRTEIDTTINQRWGREDETTHTLLMCS